MIKKTIEENAVLDELLKQSYLQKIREWEQETKVNYLGWFDAGPQRNYQR
jgi:hypothetical protein